MVPTSLEYLLSIKTTPTPWAGNNVQLLPVRFSSAMLPRTGDSLILVLTAIAPAQSPSLHSLSLPMSSSKFNLPPLVENMVKKNRNGKTTAVLFHHVSTSAPNIFFRASAASAGDMLLRPAPPMFTVLLLLQSPTASSRSLAPKFCRVQDPSPLAFIQDG